MRCLLQKQQYGKTDLPGNRSLPANHWSVLQWWYRRNTGMHHLSGILYREKQRTWRQKIYHPLLTRCQWDRDLESGDRLAKNGFARHQVVWFPTVILFLYR